MFTILSRAYHFSSFLKLLLAYSKSELALNKIPEVNIKRPVPRPVPSPKIGPRLFARLPPSMSKGEKTKSAKTPAGAVSKRLGKNASSVISETEEASPVC